MTIRCPKCLTLLDTAGHCSNVDCPTNTHLIDKSKYQLITKTPTDQLLVARTQRFYAISNETIRAMLVFIREIGTDDLDGELVKEFCGALLEAANVENLNGCRLCGG